MLKLFLRDGLPMVTPISIAAKTCPTSALTRKITSATPDWERNMATPAMNARIAKMSATTANASTSCEWPYLSFFSEGTTDPVLQNNFPSPSFFIAELTVPKTGLVSNFSTSAEESFTLIQLSLSRLSEDSTWPVKNSGLPFRPS